MKEQGLVMVEPLIEEVLKAFWEDFYSDEDVEEESESASDGDDISESDDSKNLRQTHSRACAAGKVLGCRLSLIKSTF